MSSKSFDVLLISIGNGINLLVNFLTVPYLVRMLSYDEYGSYGQVLIIVNLLKEIFAYSLHVICNNFYAEKKYPAASIFTNLLILLSGLAMTAVLIMLSLSPFVAASLNNSDLHSLLYVSLINLLFQVPFPVLFSTLVFFGHAKRASMITVVSNIIRVVLMFVSIHVYHSVWMLMIGLSIASFLQFVLFFFAIPKSLRRFEKPDKGLLMALFISASPLVITAIFERAVYYIDGLMISVMTTTKDYAIYRAGAFEVPFISAIFGYVSAVVMPELARLYIKRDTAQIIALKRKAISYSAFLIYPVFIFLLFFSQPLVTFYLSERYAQSAVIFTIFCCSLLLRINDYQDIIITFGRIKVLMLNMIWMVVLNIIINYLMIIFFGIEGSAVAFVLHLLTFAAVLSFFNSKILGCKISDVYDFNLFGKVLLISVILIVPVWMVYHWLIPSILFLVLVAPVYVGLVYYSGVKWKVMSSDLFLQLLNRVPLLKRISHGK